MCLHTCACWFSCGTPVSGAVQAKSGLREPLAGLHCRLPAWWVQYLGYWVWVVNENHHFWGRAFLTHAQLIGLLALNPFSSCHRPVLSPHGRHKQVNFDLPRLSIVEIIGFYACLAASMQPTTAVQGCQRVWTRTSLLIVPSPIWESF